VPWRADHPQTDARFPRKKALRLKHWSGCVAVFSRGVMNASPVSPKPWLTPLDGALYALVLVLWSTSWIAIHFQLGVVEPVVSVLWRFLIGAAVMWVWVLLRRDRLRFPLSDHLRFIGLALCLFSTNFVLFYEAGLLIASGLMSVVFSIASVINGFMGVLVFRQRMDRRVLAGGLIGACGVALMFLPEFTSGHMGWDAGKGLILCVAGTLCFCTGNLVATSIQRRGIGVHAANAYAMSYAVPYLALICLVMGLPFKVDWAPIYMTSLLWTGLVATTVSFVAYITLLNRIGAARAAYVTVLSPAVALLISTWFENYQWSWPAAFGLAAVMAGNVLVLRGPRAPKNAE
jgi:drug/metabolite transporter (DMT)-like permease